MTKVDLTSQTAEDKFDVTAEARRRGVEPYQVRATQAVNNRLMADIVADFRRPLSQSASMISQSSKAPARGNGWVDPPPLKPPAGIAVIDKMCEAAAQRDRIAAIQERLDAAWVEARLRDKGPLVEHDYNPFDAEHMKK
jgi:hypothetical protein